MKIFNFKKEKKNEIINKQQELYEKAKNFCICKKASLKVYILKILKRLR